MLFFERRVFFKSIFNRAKRKLVILFDSSEEECDKFSSLRNIRWKTPLCSKLLVSFFKKEKKNSEKVSERKIRSDVKSIKTQLFWRLSIFLACLDVINHEINCTKPDRSALIHASSSTTSQDRDVDNSTFVPSCPPFSIPHHLDPSFLSFCSRCFGGVDSISRANVPCSKISSR